MVHGSVHGAGFAGRGRGLFVLGFSEPVTSLLGGCYMKWILGILVLLYVKGLPLD